MTATPSATTWRNRITGSGEEAPDQLLANPANWRIHPKAQQDALAGALDAVGWVQQVLVNRRTGFVVDGHARVALALSRGEPTVPVLYVDLSPDEEALVLATLDPIGAMAGRDDEKLRALLADVSVDDAGLLALLGDLAEARAGAFDLLLAGYSDRWQRNLRRTLELLEDGLHPAGVALVMCDRRILSSDPQDWDELISEAAGAEKYSRRLSERITDGYAAKFDRRDDPGGHAGLGFRRLVEPPHTLEVDPETIGTAVALFERYALGNVSAKDLAEETGLAESRIRMILMNPIYNGWIRRHRRSRNETRKPAPWRSNPPVSDELWARVEDVRRSKTRAGGTGNPDRVDLLKGLLECVCGRRIRSDGTFADGRHRKLHASPCPDWGTRARLGDEVWEEPILAQLEAIELDDTTIAAVVASLGSGPRPVTLDRARIERQIRELALEHAAGRLEDGVYLERLHELRDAKENVERKSADGITPERAIAWLRELSATWTGAEAAAEKADLLHAIYDRITVAGRKIVSVRLTPSAYAHGIALVLPEKVAVARPTGFEPATFGSGGRRSIH